MKSWTGPYAGVFVGAGGVVDELTSPIGPGFGFNGIGGEGMLFGGLVGWNWQVSPSWVVGLQGDIAWSGLDTTGNAGPFTLDAQPNPIWSISARAGWLANPDTLLYLIGGYSATDYDVTLAGPGGSITFTQDYDGFHIGTGIETRISPSVSARVEYRFTKFSSESWGTGGIINVEPSIHSANLAFVWNWQNREDVSYAEGPAPTFIGGNWTGGYIGLVAGAGAVVNELTSPIGPGFGFNGIGGEGGLIGGLAGWNWQTGPAWVLGIQGDFAWTNLETTGNAGPFSLSAEPSPIWNLSLRAGWLANPDTLLYLIGGYSAADYDVTLAGPGGSITFSQSYQGGHIGAGLETRLSSNVTGRIEYRYTQFGAESWGTGGLINVEPSVHTGTAALVWNFTTN